MASFSERLIVCLLLAMLAGNGCKSTEEVASGIRGVAPVPGATFPEATNEQETLYEQALAMWPRGDTAELRQLLQTIENSEPGSQTRANAIILHAELERRDGEYRNALARLERLQRRSPAMGQLSFSLGGLYQHANRPMAAEEAFRDAFRETPSLLRAYVALGALLEENGREDDAYQVMIAYERQIQALGRKATGDLPIRDKLAAIDAMRLGVPDPRVSRNLVRALRDDAWSVQRAALDALAEVGTTNALGALESFAEDSGNATLARRAAEVANIVRQQ